MSYLSTGFNTKNDTTEKNDRTYFLEPVPANLPRHTA